MRNVKCSLLLTSCLFSMPIVAFGQVQDRIGPAAAEEGVADTSVAELHIEQLARFLRIQNYELHRMDRAQYNRQTDELQQRLDNWRKSNRDAAKTRELIGWLNRSLGGESPLARSSRPVEPLPVPRAPTVAPPDLAPPFNSNNALGASELPSAPGVKTEINTSVPPLPEDGTLPEATIPSPTAGPTSPQLSATVNPATGEPSAENLLLGGASSTIDDLSHRIDQVAPLTNLPSSVPPPVMLPALADVPAAPPFVSPAFLPKTLPQLNIEVPKIGGLAELRGSSQRPDAATAGNSEAKGRVNFTEVAALTRSYNVSLKTLETKLSTPTKWTADELEPLVDQLEDLDRRREDLTLYAGALPAEERSQLLSLDSQDEAIRLLSKRIAETRNNLTTSTDGEPNSRVSTPDGSTRSATTTRRDLAQLDGFSRKLAALAARKER